MKKTFTLLLLCVGVLSALPKKTLATFATLLCLMFMMPLKVAGAVKTVVNVTGEQAKVTSYSTVYVGEVVLDGQQSFYYLYSEDVNNAPTVLGSLWQSLKNFKGGMYSAMLTNYYDLPDDNKGIALCSNPDFVSMMNVDWKNALPAGMACLPKNTSAASSSSNDLFLSDADFAARCTFEESADIVDNAGNDLAISGPIGKLSSTNTDNVTYKVIDGELVKYVDRQIDYTCEMVTVIYTRAEFQSPLTKPFSCMIRCVSLPDLYAGKMHALLYRNWKNRVKGHDWYDFQWYVANRVPLDFQHLRQRIREFNEEDITKEDFIRKLREKISTTDIESVKHDVRGFVTNLHELDIWSNTYFLQLADMMVFK